MDLYGVGSQWKRSKMAEAANGMIGSIWDMVEHHITKINAADTTSGNEIKLVRQPAPLPAPLPA